MHRARVLKHGEPGDAEPRRAPDGSGTLAKSGYLYMPHKMGETAQLEHRFVMEQHLGRKLLILSESTTLTELDHLELWSTTHPSGQRIDQLVEWAKEILERYGD